MEEEKNMGARLAIADEVAKGVYCNLAMIAHSKSEFILDFVQALPGSEYPQVRSRVIIAPEQTKRLLLTLADNLQKYEEMFGEIRLPEAPETVPFAGVKGEA